MQIETADVERQFRLQHPEEAADMPSALGESVDGEPQAAVPQFAHRLRAGLIPRSQIKRGEMRDQHGLTVAGCDR